VVTRYPLEMMMMILLTKAAKRRRLNERAGTLLKELKVETAEGFVLICINWNSAAT